MNTDGKTGAKIFSTLLVGIFFLIGFVVGIHIVGTIMMSAIHDELSCINPLGPAAAGRVLFSTPV